MTIHGGRHPEDHREGGEDAGATDRFSHREDVAHGTVARTTARVRRPRGPAVILVESAGGVPSVLADTARVQAALAPLRRHHEGRRRAGSAPPVPEPLWEDPTVREALGALFHDKCAYCESPDAPTAPLAVDHFRPTSGALAADGTESRSHYWWLAYSWDNLVLACSDCTRAKGNRFPVDGPRLERTDPVAQEHPLLLDPRGGLGPDGEDSPSRHLVFLADGTVASVTERGTATIDVLQLNRPTLVAARREAAAEVREALTKESAASQGPVLAHLDDPDEPYRALRTQLVATALGDQSLTEAPVTRSERRHTKAEYDTRQKTRQSVGLHEDLDQIDDAGRASYFAAARWIERVVVRNFRPVDHVDIDLSRSTSAHAPWHVLLGDNGSGKSSILQAIALTLIGPSDREALGVRPDQVLRHGSRSGGVDLHLSGLPTPLTLRFSRGSESFDGEAAPQALLLGYGSMRLLPRDRSVLPTGPSPTVRVGNLFDPLAPMTDPRTWLLSLPDAQFDDVAVSLGMLLTLDERTRLARTDADVHLRSGRRRDRLEELSDGYQSMLVLACDVMRTVLGLWASPSQAEGIVLIDELGAHLHPRWRMRIVGALRQVLPRVQFVVTTHDPLCLRGLEDGEVTVVRRAESGRVVAIGDLPPVKGLRVDQLLTSEHFGLGSTDDPEVDALFAEYYRLRAKPRPSGADRSRTAELEARLGELRQLGTTERERLLLHSVDDFIARRRETGDPAAVVATPGAATEGVLADLAAIWSEAIPDRPAGRDG